MKEAEDITLWGVVEEIVYHNDDNDYTVMEIIDKEGALVTAVGKIAYVAEGEEVTLYGGWVTHAEYGRQFAFENYERELPTGKKAILRYLSSRVIKGVGPVTASRIVARYGEETFDVMEHHPEWLSEISGISAKKAAEIHKSFVEQTGVRALMMLCRDFFTTSVIGRVYQKWGGAALEKTKENPYALCSAVYGVSFEAADRLAAALGFAHNAPERIAGGLTYILEFNAQNNGHTCLPEDKLLSATVTHLSVTEEEARDALRGALKNGVLSSVTVKDTHFIALPVYAEAEKTVADRLSLLDRYCALFSERDASLFITRLEEEQGIVYAAAQRRAITAALSNGVMILTGGPGTGKTTVVRALLRIFASADLKTLLLAPTGRAANRMSAAASFEAKTIHRALEMEKADDLFPIYRRDEHEPLDASVIIVDEASMIDVRLMAALLRAIKRGSRLILIGDADQLPSVGAGRLLCDLVESKRFCTVCLTEIFRQSAESLIVTNAHRINRGEVPILDAKDKDFFFLPTAEENIPDLIADLITRRLPKAYGKSIAEDIQVITPSRKGRAGTERLNDLLREAENPPASGKKERKMHGTLFREGDRVMQVRNNYDLSWKKDGMEGNGVFNGDVGVLQALDGEDGGTVLFDGRTASYDKDALEELDHAYAITIHKSQGSEYPVVIVPLYDCPPMLLTRNLFYTAVTRARQMVILVGRKEIAMRMVENDRHVMRYTLLPTHLEKV